MQITCSRKIYLIFFLIFFYLTDGSLVDLTNFWISDKNMIMKTDISTEFKIVHFISCTYNKCPLSRLCNRRQKPNSIPTPISNYLILPNNDLTEWHISRHVLCTISIILRDYRMWSEQSNLMETHPQKWRHRANTLLTCKGNLTKIICHSIDKACRKFAIQFIALAIILEMKLVYRFYSSFQ